MKGSKGSTTLHKLSLIVLATLFAGTIALPFETAWASTYKVLYAFCALDDTCPDGAGPVGGLVSDAAGNLYGTTNGGGAYEFGTIFELVNEGGGKWQEVVLHSFCSDMGACADGRIPVGTLVIDSAGNLYGVTSLGGGYGNIYELSPNANRTQWTVQVLHDFCSSCSDGYEPAAGLTYSGQSSGNRYDGKSTLYGTTSIGGKFGQGVVFSLAPGKTWTETPIYSFCAQGGQSCTDGSQPMAPIYVQGSSLIGTTVYGGNNAGLVFKLAPGKGGVWTESVLYTFCTANNCVDGGRPGSGIVMDNRKNIFGTAALDGPNCSNEYCGTAFKLSPAGSETVLHGFCYGGPNNCTGSVPLQLIIEKSILYGTTGEGGATNYGVIYKLVNNSYKVLHTFCAQPNCTDGGLPRAPVLPDTAGDFFGVASWGGIGEYPTGVVYELTP